MSETGNRWLNDRVAEERDLPPEQYGFAVCCAGNADEGIQLPERRDDYRVLSTDV